MTKLRAFSVFSISLALIIISLGGVFAIPASANGAAFTWYVDPLGTDATGYGVAPGDRAFLTIGYAVSQALAGDIISVAAGTYAVSSVINLNLANLTVTGAGSGLSIIQVSGTGDRFDISADGVTLQGFTIEKTDKTGEQNIIRIRASNVTITNNVIFGRFVIGDGEVSRAMVINAGAYTGINITNNEIYDLRQPAYMSGTNTGTISGNYVYRTKGWVVEGGNMTFTGNTWGTGADANVYDIAILATCPAGYYTDIPAMSAANNDAFIEDQRTSPFTLSIVYVDGSVLASGDGTARSPKKTISEGVTRVVIGGKIYVATGTYAENVIINKRLMLDGAGNGGDPGSNTVIDPPSGHAITVQSGGSGSDTDNRTVIKDLHVTGADQGIRFDSGATIRYVSIDNVAAVSNTGAGFNLRETSTYQDIRFINATASSNAAGIQVQSTSVSMDGLTVTGGSFINNTGCGLVTLGGTVTNVSISDATFSGNAPNSNTNGDVVLSGFNGNASFSNVNITSNSSDCGIRLSGSSTVAAAGTVSFTNVSIAGAQRMAAIALSRYNNVSNVSFSNVNLSSTAPAGLHLGYMDGSLNIANTTFSGNNSSPGSVSGAFDVSNPGNIVLGKHRGLDGNDATVSVNAASAVFTGAANNFAIEDRVYHKVDKNSLGLVNWVPGNLYVTTNSGSIQRGIDAATPGDTVNVQAGLFDERININKAITLRGATAGTCKKGFSVPGGYAYNTATQSVVRPSTALEQAVVQISSDNIIFDGFVVANEVCQAGGVYQDLVEVTQAVSAPIGIQVLNNVLGPNTNTASQDGTKGRSGLCVVGPHSAGPVKLIAKCNKIFDNKGNGCGIMIVAPYGPTYHSGSPYTNYFSGSVIEDNEIKGNHRTGIELAGGVQGGSSPSDYFLIKNNIISDNGYFSAADSSNLKYGHGVMFIRGGGDKNNSDAAGSRYISFEGNHITSNEKSGVYMGPVNSDITFFNNTIDFNGPGAGSYLSWDGVRVDLDEAYYTAPKVTDYTRVANINFNRNNITSNGSGYGINIMQVPTSGPVIAALNWWGNVSGPTQDASPVTYGDKVTANVTYQPWLIATYTGQSPVAGLAISTTSPIPAGGVGSAYSRTMAATGGTSPYKWYNYYNLPAWLTVNADTGVLSGTPSTAGTYNFQLQARDVHQGIWKDFSLQVASGPLAITTASPLPVGFTETAYNQVLQASGGSGSGYTWALASGALPGGLTLADNGTIYGTPTAAGDFSFRARVSDSTPMSATKDFTLKVWPILEVTTASPMPDGDVSAVYSQALTATGGSNSGYHWNLISGSLPPGLSLTGSDNGTISGTPTTAGDYIFTMRVMDSASNTADKAFSVKIWASSLNITTTSPLNDGEVNLTYLQVLQATGGANSKHWTVDSGDLPGGLSLADNGSISGTPSAGGTFNFTAKVESGGQMVTKDFALTVYDALALTTTSLPDGYRYQLYSQALARTGGKSPFTWAITAGTLPAGLTLNGTTGVISGNVTQMGDFSLTATVTDALGATSSVALTLHSGPGNTGIFGWVGVGVDPPERILHVKGNVALFHRNQDSAGFIIQRTDSNRWVLGVNESEALGKGFVLSTYPVGAPSSTPRLHVAENGTVNVFGILTKGGGTFKIDHPMEPQNRYLQHSFVESPDMLNVYNGSVVLDEKGEATVDLPAYFTALNKSFTYQLDTVGGFAPLYIKQEIKDNSFTITGGKLGMKVSWQVTGIRKDPFALANPITVEFEKPAGEKGYYIHPAEWGIK